MPNHTESDRLNQLLDEAGVRARFDPFIADPVGQIDALRSDPELQAIVAWADVLPKLLVWFTPLDTKEFHGWSQDSERSGLVGDGTVCVAWSFSGSYENGEELRAGKLVEVPNMSFNGLQAVGQPVELRGVTFMGVDDPPGTPNAPVAEPTFRLRRYIDWAGLYTQLGLTLNWRAPHEAGARPRVVS